MLTVTVRAIMDMAEKMGGHVHLIATPEGATLSDLVGLLEQKYLFSFYDIIQMDKITEQNPYVQRSAKIMLLLNGRNISFLEGLDTLLHDGDDLFFLSPVGGG